MCWLDPAGAQLVIEGDHPPQRSVGDDGRPRRDVVARDAVLQVPVGEANGEQRRHCVSFPLNT
jgi:hypothetical protein